ncbi:MAG: DNA topoisomerase VI subunit B [Candidatus Eisenbacteria bacterium]|uniref:Type 2 DNA topoisomerase 6 subunit B n=1 Tax=Eiseniibacteriota bacterium TaxID=2212470 RepID=A0A538SMZ3_UNCEI|nr:MAG: DNA topoisomerase VI subunit B [Candidatus Eisenbacteria bacterium]TMQ63065.1 MAG: DNA topoisomerase VI subunit B [Candidatus Eisenbacteria bacterium]
MAQPQLKRIARKEKLGRAGKKAAPKPVVRLTAHDLAARQREISVSEFFTKNRHLLGFDSPAKALLTTVKEAVDNALDACEEAGILPDLLIEIGEISETRYRVAVQDNGPGIVKAQIPKIFGQLLYGSKFHTLRQARGQQGIGISAAGMYGQLTTGKPIRIISKTGPTKPAHEFEIQIDTKRNQPVPVSDRELGDWHVVDPTTGEKSTVEHGTKVELEIEATYKKGRHSVDGYVEQTAIANPHAKVSYVAPDGERHEYARVAGELPKAPLEIKPHPHGIELGILLKMLHETKARNITSFLHAEFSRVSGPVAEEIVKSAGLPLSMSPPKAAREQAEALYNAIQAAKLMAPQSNVLSPIGDELLIEGLKKQVTADFYAATSRSPAVYRGNPFLIEAALAYGGGQLPADELVTMLRFANRVPLLYQQSACAITKSVVSNTWKNYGIQQARGALPTAPMVLMVHIASVWVPFTSESKEAVASYPEIVKEIKLALQDVGRKLGLYIRRGLREADAEKKASYIEKYIPHIGIALQEILGIDDKRKEKVCATLKDTLERSRKNE